MHDSVRLHLRSDVPVGSYVSGGLDSSIVATLAADAHRRARRLHRQVRRRACLRRERARARPRRRTRASRSLRSRSAPHDFVENIQRVVYHLDYPVAGPGSFPQYMVSGLAAQHRKVVLGGQGGDEIFGGYARYLIAYFEQCIKGAIDGTMHTGNFVVTYESIIPNLTALANTSRC